MEKLVQRGRVYTHDAIQSAGDLLRGTGHCADLNRRKKLLWTI